MTGKAQRNLPAFFETLMKFGCLSKEQVYSTSDGFFAAARSVADILVHQGVTTVLDRKGNPVECRLVFDDWYLYAVAEGNDCTCSLFQMREQGYGAKQRLYASGDAPGVTVSFVEMGKEILLDCLHDLTPENRMRLNEEINRVVERDGQCSDERLKGYFIRTEAQGPYLIAKLYTEHIAALAEEGFLAVPERYASDYKKQGTYGRVPEFIEENNRAAGKVICDHEKIYIDDPFAPTEWERMAILATHVGNTSVFSFAAEVQFHAKPLSRWAKIPVPFVGRGACAGGIRADMSIGNAEVAGAAPYYRANSSIVRQQYQCHKDDIL